MKKLFLMAVAAVAMLATSCSKDDTNAVAVGEKSTVTFAVEAPVMATRADLGKAENVDQLYYAVYSEDGNTHYPELSGVKNNAFSNLKATVEIELVNGKAYTVVFWAQNSQAPYTFDGRNAKVTVNYDDEFIGNQDSYDAFYKTHSVATVNGARTEKEIILTRPFAQLNIATADYETAINGGFRLEKVQVEVPAYSTLNFLELDENDNATVEDGETTRVFNFADIFTTEQITVGSKDYKLLSMNYILINTKEMETVKFIAKQEGNLTQTYTYNNVPLQRNYKTNIIGNLLTSTLDFDITIDPIFEKEVDTYVTDADALINAVAGVADGDTITVAAGTYPVVLDITGAKNFTLKAAKDAVVTIAGVDHQTNGTPSTVTFEGITIDNSIIATRATEGGWFTGTAQNIAPCVGAWGGDLTFNNCKFIVAGTSGRETGVMTWWTTNLATFKFNSCVFEGKDSQSRAMQIYGNVNMEVKNCTFTTAKDYTLKYVAGEGNVAVFNDNKVENSKYFVQLGSSDYPGNKYTVKINKTTLGTGVYHYVVANPENQVIFVDDVLVKIVSEDIADTIAAIAALEAGEEFTLTLDEDLNVTGTDVPQVAVTAGDVTIEGNGYGITSGSASSYGFVANGENASMTINNTDIVSNGGAIGAVNGAQVAFNSGRAYVDTASTSGRYIFYLEGKGSTITINGGTFSWDPADNQKRAYVYAGAGTFVYINGGTFGKASTRSGYEAGILGEGTVVVKGGTFGFNPSDWVADGYKAEKSGDVWVVSFDGNVAEDVASINETLAQGGNVLLSNDVAVASNEVASNGYGATGINQNGGIIDGNGNDISVDAWSTWDSAISTSGGVIKNVNIVGGFRGIFVKKGSKVYLDNVVVDGPVYTISCDTASYQGLEAKNSTFNGWTSYAKTIGEVSFTNCQFGEGQGYAFCRPYAPTTFVGCNFEAGFAIDARDVVIFENCTLGGEALTSENIASLMAGGADKVTLR